MFEIAHVDADRCVAVWERFAGVPVDPRRPGGLSGAWDGAQGERRPCHAETATVEQP
jgi:hypothetical protein